MFFKITCDFIAICKNIHIFPLVTHSLFCFIQYSLYQIYVSELGLGRVNSSKLKKKTKSSKSHFIECDKVTTLIGIDFFFDEIKRLLVSLNMHKIALMQM